MKLKRILMGVLMGLLVFGWSVPGFGAPVTPTTTGGFLSDFDGNLLMDSDGYYVLNLRPDMIQSGEVSISLNQFAALFLDDFKNVSSNLSVKKLRIVNETGKELIYKDYSFTTENTLPRTDHIFAAANGSFSNFMNRAYGSAYTAMMSTITHPKYRTDLCLDIKGFDGKNMNLMTVPLRTVNDAVKAFYKVKDNFDVTLPQMMHLDENLRQAGYASYADYLKAYYGVADLMSLTPEQTYNVLGTTNGAQSGITNWKDNTIGGKPIPAGELDQLTNEFKIWGIMDLNMDAADQAAYPYVPNFFMMETDPQVLKFAYEYVYRDGLRFTFDSVRYPFDRTDSELGRGGSYGIRSYLDKAPASNAMVASLFGASKFSDGSQLKFDHVTAGLYVPNAWNQHRLYDYGFKLVFTVRGTEPQTTKPQTKPEVTKPVTKPETSTPGQTVPSNNGTPPKTGDETNLDLLRIAFASSIGLVVLLLIGLRKKRNDEKGPTRRGD